MDDTHGRAPLARESGNIPLYLQAAQLIRQWIYQGQIADILPAESELSDVLNVSPSVVRAALRELRGEGLVETRHGVGSRAVSVPAPVRVQARRGDVVTSRMPTPAERDELGLAPGVPVVSVRRGEREQLYSSLTVQVVYP